MLRFEDYIIRIYRNQPWGFVATMEEFAGCYALMATPEEALAELRLVFAMLAGLARERNRPLPPPRTLAEAHAVS